MSDHETTAALHKMLSERYFKKGTGRNAEWVLIHEAPLPGNAGYCDMIALGVWQSTKNRIIGHEVKASRADWLKEVDQPDKSEAFSRFCNRWYIVAAPGIVKLEELKPEWGLMEATRGMSSLKIKRQPKDTEAEQLTPGIMAAWFRRVAAGPGEAEIQRRVNSQLELRRKRDAASGDYRLTRAKNEIERLRSMILGFEERSGLTVSSGYRSEHNAKVARLLSKATPDELAASYQSVHSQLERLTATAADVAQQLMTITEPSDEQSTTIS
ncbi:MAG: hypothetical protein AAGJ40_09535 [Planctomycetota bacterium]